VAKPVKFPYVLIEWLDAESEDEWVSLESALAYSIPTIESVGFLIRSDSTTYTLAQNWDAANENVSMLTQIPSSMIVRVVHLCMPE